MICSYFQRLRSNFGAELLPFSIFDSTPEGRISQWHIHIAIPIFYCVLEVAPFLHTKIRCSRSLNVTIRMHRSISAAAG